MPKLTKTLSLALAATGMTLAMPAAAAVPNHAAPQAHANAAVGADMTYEHGKKHKKRKHHRHHGYDRYDRYDDRRVVVVRERAPVYYRESRPYYMGYDRNWGRPVNRDTRIWRGRDNRYYCRKDDGTTGLLVGAGVGALIGHEVAGRGGDRTLGAIVGGAAGALLGRSIDRSSTRCG